MSTENVGITIIQLKQIDFTCEIKPVYFLFSEIFQERKKERERERDKDSPEHSFLSPLLVQIFVSPCWIEGPPPVFYLWASPKLKPCRPKTWKLQKYRLKQIDFTCLDLTCIFLIFRNLPREREREREREIEKYSPEAFFLSPLLVQILVSPCWIGGPPPVF